MSDSRFNPAKRWRCGYEAMGMPCSAGPTAIGSCSQLAARQACDEGGAEGCRIQCRTAADCELVKRRPEDVRDAGDEPYHCVPIKSFWFSRQMLGLNLAILCGGVLLCCMALPSREAAFVPGTLTEPHAQILGNKLASERCSMCHPNSHSGAGGVAVRSQDELCLRCHAEHMPEAALRSPHDLKPAELERIKRAEWKLAGGLTASSGHALELNETNCAMCHIEHRGPHHDLTHISDMRCQACHQVQFAGLGAGHPEFQDFPYRRERRIAFDHASHADHHFAQKSEKFDCNACHVDASRVGSAGEVFRGLGYERSCARCHASSIRADQSDGWIVFQLPSINADDAQVSGLGLDDWPNEARFGYDGRIPLPAAWLLYADPQARQALQRLGSDGQLSSMQLSDDTSIESARVLARSLRMLVRRIAEHGQAAWAESASTAAEHIIERELTKGERQLIERLAAGMPPDLFRQIETQWFRADQRLVAEDSRSPTTASLISSKENAGELEDKPQLGRLTGLKHVAQGGWYLDEELLAVRYMPTGHADPLLAAWTEFSLWLSRAAEEKTEYAGTSVFPACLESSAASMLPGKCAECHLLSPNDGESPMSNWRSVTQPTDVKTFTKFNHGPHLTLPQVRDCQYCHIVEGMMNESSPPTQLKRTVPSRSEVGRLADVWERYKTVSMSAAHDAIREHLRGEFRGMQQSQCTACHNQGGANSSCTQCHNYHVGSPGFEWSQEASP